MYYIRTSHPKENSLRGVSVIGIGMTSFGSSSESIISLASNACKLSLQDARIDQRKIDAFYLGNFAGESFSGQNHLAPLISNILGLNLVPCTRVEGACASGGLALRQGIMAIKSGEADIVMVCGVEKMTNVNNHRVNSILSSAGDTFQENSMGISFASLFAFITQRYLYENNITREELSLIPVKNHSHGILNEKAHIRKKITKDDVLKSRRISGPIGLLDCSPVSDGSASVILCGSEIAHDMHSKPISILASTQSSDLVSLIEKNSITSFEATRKAADSAFNISGLERSDIDLVELHDCFTVAEPIALEDMGFFKKGKGWRGALEGMTLLGGSMPVNTSGGLKSKGHPVGATGLAQIYELILQLRNSAGERQVPDARYALSQNMGGLGATCSIHILGKME